MPAIHWKDAKLVDSDRRLSTIKLEDLMKERRRLSIRWHHAQKEYPCGNIWKHFHHVMPGELYASVKRHNGGNNWSSWRFCTQCLPLERKKPRRPKDFAEWDGRWYLDEYDTSMWFPDGARYRWRRNYLTTEGTFNTHHGPITKLLKKRSTGTHVHI